MGRRKSERKAPARAAALDRLWALAAPDPRRAPEGTKIATPSPKSSLRGA